MSLVILIRICLIPLFVKQIMATRAMQTLQPEMKKIQERSARTTSSVSPKR
ncbi:YidC/Oxa1 family membrane protein insertase [Streptomyces sp. L7]